MARVNLTNVTKAYDDVIAVDDMNLDIQDGEFVCLVGPSGCGKSTTLETIAGLTKPTSGSIHIGDRDVTDLAPKDRGISMVFQNIALFPHMNVSKNISYGLRLRNVPKDEIERRVRDAAEIVQIEELLDRQVSELSGGQRQRVGIARAIIREPEAFLMDEPLANLDAKLRVHMRTELARLHKELGTTTIYVTHDQEEAMTMSDRIAVINDGQLQQIAPPLECYDQPTNLFVAGFIGSPAMNFLDAEVSRGTIQGEAFDIDIDETRIDEVADGQKVVVGIRPSDVYRASDADSLSNPTEPFTAVTDVIEPVGDETYVYMFVDGDDAAETTIAGHDDELLMKIDPYAPISEDERIELVFDRDRVHVFDDDTEEALFHGLDDRAEQVAGRPDHR